MIDTKKLRASALAASDYNSYSFAKDKPMLCSVEPQTILALLGRLEKLEQDRTNLIRENAELSSQLQAARRVCEAAERVQHYDCAGAGRETCVLCQAIEAYKQAERGDE